MERYNPFIRLFLAGALCALLLQAFSQDQTIGINTNDPNANAVLHLHAVNGDQGLLVPTLTSAQKEAMPLDASDNGLLVYDGDDNAFYYWHAPAWVALSVSDNQQLSLDGNVLSIANGNEVDLSAIVPTTTTPTATDVSFANEASALAATTVQEAIDLLDTRLDEGDFQSSGGDAATVSYSTAQTSLTSGDVQGALDEIHGLIYDPSSTVEIPGTNIDFDDSSTGMSVSNFQEALDEFFDRVYSNSSSADIPGKNLDFDDTNASFAASNVQEALEHLDEAVLDLESNSSYLVDDNSNHLLGEVDGLPTGGANILLGNGSPEPADPSGSYNLALGYGARTVGSNVSGIALGTGTFVNGNRGLAIGTGTRVESGAENALAFGTNTVANRPNSILFGDGLSSARYRVGVNVQNPTATFQVGDHLGFFHFQSGGTDGQVISDNIYAGGSDLYARTANKEGVAMVLEDGVFKVFAINAKTAAQTILDINTDFRPILVADKDTLTVEGSARFGGTLSIGPDASGTGTAIPGTLAYDYLDGELNVYDGTEWRRVVTESYAPAPVVLPTATVVPDDGILSSIPDDEFYPLEASGTSQALRELPTGYPGQKLIITNSGTAAQGTDLNLVVLLDHDSTGGINIDIAGSISPNQAILPQGSSIQLLYDSILGRWVELSRSINQGAP